MLSERIKTLRKKKGMSQKELALELHVVRQNISKWEKQNRIAALYEELQNENNCNYR